MPDDNSGENSEREGVQHDPKVEAIVPPSPPNHPPGPPAPSVTGKSMEGAIHAVEDRVRRAEWLMIGLTAAIALFALGTVIVGILQWNAMSGQLSEMKSGGIDTHNLAEAAKKQAEKAETISTSMQRAVGALNATNANADKSLNASIGASQNDQRAWIGITGFEKPVFEIGREFIVRAALKNTGRTPALRAQLSANLNPVSRGTMPDLDDLHGKVAKGLIPPNDHLYFTLNGTANRGISQTGIDLIKNGDQVIFVYGILRYFDVFGLEHWTKFCDVLNPKTMEFDLCGIGNDIDRPNQSQERREPN